MTFAPSSLQPQGSRCLVAAKHLDPLKQSRDEGLGNGLGIFLILRSRSRDEGADRVTKVGPLALNGIEDLLDP